MSIKHPNCLFVDEDDAYRIEVRAMGGWHHCCKEMLPVRCPEAETVVGRIVAFAPSAIARTRLVIVVRASSSCAAGYRSSVRLSVKVEGSSWPAGLNSYVLPCGARRKYSVPRNVILGVAADWGARAAEPNRLARMALLLQQGR